MSNNSCIYFVIFSPVSNGVASLNDRPYCAIINTIDFDSQKKEDGMKAIKILVILLLIAPVCVFGIILGNIGEEAYEEGGDGTSSTSAVMSSVSRIRTLIIQSAGFYLKSHSDIHLFLNRVEMGDLNGVDFDELASYLNNAGANMVFARNGYEELLEVAAATPYRTDFIQKLKDFDYETFLNGSRFNPVVFNEMREFLSKGNVTGFFNRIFEKTEGLIERINQMKTEIFSNRLPSDTNLWDTTQEYADTLLFGQYATRIFGAIK